MWTSEWLKVLACPFSASCGFKREPSDTQVYRMKVAVFIVVLSSISACFGGVGVLSPAEEEDVLDLYRKLCANRFRDEGPQPGDTAIYCKESPDIISERVQHQVYLPGKGVGDQVVFIRPPPTTYTHNVEIQGSISSGQNTKIYVLPQQTRHEISSDYSPAPVIVQKPTVYFLNRDA